MLQSCSICHFDDRNYAYRMCRLLDEVTFEANFSMFNFFFYLNPLCNDLTISWNERTIFVERTDFCVERINFSLE